MMRRFICMAIMVACLLCLFTGCKRDVKNDADLPEDTIVEEDPFSLAVGDGTSIDLPAVDGMEWDEDESIQEIYRPSNNGNNDLPYVSGGEWDEDVVSTPAPTPIVTATPIPTSTPLVTVTPTATPTPLPTETPVVEDNTNDDNTSDSITGDWD